MEINTIEYQQDGSFLVNKNVDANDDRQIIVPNDMGNRHRVMIQEWIDEGNTPTPYVAPETPFPDRRIKGYGSIGDQLDMQYRDLKDGTTEWKDHIAKVKSDIPKS
tara:strand:+ start:202 stop:519 length:318 start_codon:yes stop_codon:yes gene_type:complete